MRHALRRLGLVALIAALTVPVAASAASAATGGPVSRPTFARECSAAKPGYRSCFAIRVVPPAGAITPDVTVSGFGPADLKSAYQLPAGTAGTGKTVALIDSNDDPNAESDLAVYRSNFGLPACTTANGCFKKVNQTGGTSYPSGDTGWGGEISLDLDMVSATCPNCKILLVEATSATDANLDVAVSEAVTLGAVAISNSYGGSEYSGEVANDDPHFNHPGIAITASTGDDGYGAQYPAASRYVTAVGGTSLTKTATGRGWAETAWTDGGSGCSAYETKPTWQTDSGCTKRTIGDVSAVADPNTGVAVYDTYGGSGAGAGGWEVYGGTSASSPIVASMYAMATTPTPGTVPASYAYAQRSAFNDITSGSNGSCSPAYLCTAGVGYDGPTGLGTPIGETGLSPVVSDFSISASPSSPSLVAGSTTTSTISTAVTSGSAQTVSLSATGLPSGVTATFSPTSVTAGSSSTLTLQSAVPTVAGSYSIGVTGTATSGSHSTPLSLTVTPGTTAHLTISPPSGSITAGSSQAYTAAGTDASNNSTGNVTSATTFTIAPNGSGSATGASCTTSSCTATAPGNYTVTGTDGSATGTAALTVTVGATSSLSLSPPTASITTGGSQAYTAAGKDSVGNSTGDVTGATTFTIAPNGSGSATGASCTGNSCTATAPGNYTVTGTDGAATGTAALTISGATVAGAPTIGTAVAGNASATVSWTAPGSNGGSAVTGYVVTPYIGATAQAAHTFNSTAVSENVTGLTNGTSYTFTVAAVNGVGTGAPSGPSNAVTPAGLPAVPVLQTAVSGNASALVKWYPGSGNGSAVTGYVITPYIGATAQPAQTFNTNANSDTVTGLTNGTSYTFKIAAVNGVGTGAQSNPTPATVIGLPAAPVLQSATSGNASATVKWYPSSGNGAPVTGYVITPYIGTTAQPAQTFNTNASSDVVTGLTNGTSYTFKIAAVNTYGTGAISNPTAAIVIGLPAAPVLQSAVPANASATVKWYPTSGNGAPVTGYVITPYIGTTAQPAQTFNTNASSDVVTGLTNGTSYTFKIAAVNSLGTGAQSAATAAVVIGVPSAPVLQSAAPGNGTAKVSWWPPAANGSPITGFVITPYVGTTAQPAQTFNTTANSDVVTGLTNGTSYTFKIAAINSYGTGVVSAATAAITVGTAVAPAAPTATAGTQQASVHWVAPANNGSAITGYVVTPYLAGVAQAPVTFSSTATTEIVTGLTTGGSYKFTVAAINGVGTGPASAQSAAIVPS